MNVSTALDLALHLLIEAQKISQIVAQAQQQGRTNLTDQQMADILADANSARARLAAAIQAARQPPPPPTL